MSTGKRLALYALQYKKTILLALFLLCISVAADLAGPFVAKKVIDDHILGVHSHWFETEEGENAVGYKGSWYQREDYLEPGQETGKEVTIIQSGLELFFVEDNLPLEGNYKVAGNSLTNGETVTERFVVLTKQEAYAFYQQEIPEIIKMSGVYLGLLVVSAFFLYGQSYYLQTSANRIIQKMRNDLFSHLSTLPIRFFDHLPAGKVVSRITNDTEAIKSLYVDVISNFFSSSITIIGIYIALLILDMKLALFSLILIPVILALSLIYRTFASRYNKVIQSRISSINGMINEVIQGMPIIQAFRREKEIENEFTEMNDEYFSYQKKMIRLNGLTSFNIVNVLKNIAFVAFFVYFGNLGVQGNDALSIGLLYAFVDYLTRLFQPVQGIVNQFTNLEMALVAGDRVFSLLDEKGEEVSEDRIPRCLGNVAFEHVYFGYTDEYVLRDISFSAEQGQTVAFVGHTGSGKSSIMNLLFRYYDCDKGKIMVDGIDIKDIPRQALREHMAIVLQDPYLFTGTIASNISLNNPDISRADIEQALCEVGGKDMLGQLEYGIDTPVIEKGSTLSSGQRQLISFARALAVRPAVLILDEATSHVDTETEQTIQTALSVLKKGRTTFIIAHRLSTIKNADQIIVLDKGVISEKGSHEELMHKKGKYYGMYMMQKGEKLLI